MVPGRSGADLQYGFDELKRDLDEDVDVSIRRNLDVFEGKFALHQRQLKEELEKIMHEESNRVIDAVNRGPHDLIKHEVGLSMLIKLRLALRKAFRRN